MCIKLGWVGGGGGWWVVCGQTLRQVVAQLELELLRPCQLERKKERKKVRNNIQG